MDNFKTFTNCCTVLQKMERSKYILLFGIVAVFTVSVILIVIYSTNSSKHQESNSPKTIPQAKKARMSNKDELLLKLKSVSKSKTISGLHVYYNQTVKNGLDTIERITGVLPGLLTTFMPGHLDGATKWQTFIDRTILNWNNGYLVHIVWEFSENPLTSMEIFTQGYYSRFNDLVTEGGELNKVWKTKLDALVFYLQQLQMAGVVPICDILPYINSQRSYWGGNKGSHRLYQMTHDYLTQHHGLDCIIWVWTVTTGGQMYLPALYDYWPGNNYVDVVAIYMFSINQLTTNLYQQLLDDVGDKLYCMEYMWTVPTPQALAAQPRWSWFTLSNHKLLDVSYNSPQNMNTTFHSSSIINKGFNEFLKYKN